MNLTMPSSHWSQLTPLEIARSHPSVASYKGKVYVFGGGGPGFKSMNSSVCYNPTDNTWSKLRDMPTLRSGTMAATIGDRIFVMGGGFRQEDGMFRFLTTVEIYRPESDSWEVGPSLLMPHDYPAVAVLGATVYILGGHHPDATQGGPKSDPGFDFCERLNTDGGEWEAIAPLQVPRFALSATAVDGKILAMGGVAFRPDGFNNFTTIEVFDPATNNWSHDDTLVLPWAAAGLGSARVGDNIYIFGGYSDDSIHSRTAYYSLTEKQWHQTAALPSPVAAMGVAVCDDTIYSIGGWANDGRTPITEAFRFTP